MDPYNLPCTYQHNKVMIDNISPKHTQTEYHNQKKYTLYIQVNRKINSIIYRLIDWQIDRSMDGWIGKKING